MIKGKAKLEFGTGDIQMTSALSNGIGALCCITQEPHEIGERVPVEDSWNVDQAEVVLTFTKPESIDALIDELQDVRAMMDGTYPFEEQNYREGILDFDAFMKNQYLGGVWYTGPGSTPGQSEDCNRGESKRVPVRVRPPPN